MTKTTIFQLPASKLNVKANFPLLPVNFHYGLFFLLSTYFKIMIPSRSGMFDIIHCLLSGLTSCNLNRTVSFGYHIQETILYISSGYFRALYNHFFGYTFIFSAYKVATPVFPFTFLCFLDRFTAYFLYYDLSIQLKEIPYDMALFSVVRLFLVVDWSAILLGIRPTNN